MKITSKDVADHRRSLGLLNVPDDDASAVELLLSTARAGMLLVRPQLPEDMLPIITQSIEILTGLIGDGFDLPLPPGMTVRKSGKRRL